MIQKINEISKNGFRSVPMLIVISAVVVLLIGGLVTYRILSNQASNEKTMQQLISLQQQQLAEEQGHTSSTMQQEAVVLSTTKPATDSTKPSIVMQAQASPKISASVAPTNQSISANTPAGLAISLASNNPSPSILTGTTNSVLSVNLASTGSAAITVSSLTFHKLGSAAPQSIGNASLVENGKVIAQYSTMPYGMIVFSGMGLQIPANQSIEITLVINYSGNANPGDTMGLALDSASDISATDASGNAITPSGTFPVGGKLLAVIENSSALTSASGGNSSPFFKVTPLGASTNRTEALIDYIAKIEFSAGTSQYGYNLGKITMTFGGSSLLSGTYYHIDVFDQNEQMILATVNAGTNTITFDFSSYDITAGTSETFYLAMDDFYASALPNPAGATFSADIASSNDVFQPTNSTWPFQETSFPMRINSFSFVPTN